MIAAITSVAMAERGNHQRSDPRLIQGSHLIDSVLGTGKLQMTTELPTSQD
ncbi:hypothetical protein [Rubripirellula obstinata]|uniref:hypothetical protein n=1 Tax=Rubripirellula obstinata TaxID=406547 RepID=UPI0013904A1F|nr:hypothetical protein [Rubripirellula obstinata]